MREPRQELVRIRGGIVREAMRAGEARAEERRGSVHVRDIGDRS